MSVTLIYEFTALDGEAGELACLLVGGRDFGLTVEGCEAFDVFQNEDDPHHRVAAPMTGPIQPGRFTPL